MEPSHLRGHQENPATAIKIAYLDVYINLCPLLGEAVVVCNFQLVWMIRDKALIMMMTISWTPGNHTSDCSVTTNSHLYFILHSISSSSLNIIVHSILLSIFPTIFLQSPYLLVFNFSSRRWHKIWYWRDRRPPLSNASYLPVPLFITQVRLLSDVRARVSPNLRGAGRSQHLFYFTVFDGPAASHLLL